MCCIITVNTKVSNQLRTCDINLNRALKEERNYLRSKKTNNTDAAHDIERVQGLRKSNHMHVNHTLYASAWACADTPVPCTLNKTGKPALGAELAAPKGATAAAEDTDPS